MIALSNPIEVRLIDGPKLRGWIGDVSEISFVLSPENQGQLEKAQRLFDQIRSIKCVKSRKPSHAAPTILIGVGISVAAIAVMSVVAIFQLRNEPR